MTGDCSSGHPAVHTWIHLGTVRGHLLRVENTLAHLVPRDRTGRSPYSQVLSPRGKRIRPALLLLAAALGEMPEDAAVKAAAGVELLHEATLYHDDIVDEADLRRGEPTPQRAFGPVVAALVGSELLYATAELFADLPARLRRAASRTVDALCRGQLHELETLGDADIGVGKRVRIMRDKTARLFALASRLGAALAGVDPAREDRMARFGLRFGLCFQLADDLRDLVAPPGVLGRSTAADLRDGVYTLPVLLALETIGPETLHLRSALDQVRLNRSDASVARCLDIVTASGGLAKSATLLDGWLAAARHDLELLGPPPAVHESLDALLALLCSDIAGGTLPRLRSASMG